MSAFDDKLNELVGDASDWHDIDLCIRTCVHYAFDGHDVRVWNGCGRLFTSDGLVWLGTQDGDGNDFHVVPELSDGRDGTSPEYEFTLGYLDEETADLIGAEEWRVMGRPMTVSVVIVEPHEGLRPATPRKFVKRLTMTGAAFSSSLSVSGTHEVVRYKASVKAKDANRGRSLAPSGTYTDTCQKAYAAALGVPNDRGYEFLLTMHDQTIKRP